MNFAEITKEKMNLLRVGISLLLLVIAAVSWAGYRTVQDFRTSSQLVSDTYKVLKELDATWAAVEATDTGTRDFVLTKKAEDLEPYQKSAAILLEAQQRLGELTVGDPWQQEQVSKLSGLTTQLAALSKKTVEERNKSMAAALKVIRSDEPKLLREEIRELMGRMKMHEIVVLGARQYRAAQRMQSNTIWCGALLVVDLGILCGIAVFSIRLNHLHRVIRICAWTKKVEHEGKWITLEEYLQKTLHVPISHGICAEAAATMIADANQQAG